MKYFEKKMSLRNFICEIIDCKKWGYLNAQRSPVSEHIWTVNILKVRKHNINVHGGIFVIFL